MKSITLSNAIKQSAANKLKIESAVLLAKAVESASNADEAIAAGNPAAAIIHSVAAASCFQAANNGLKLAKTLTENGEQKRKSNSEVTEVFIQMQPLTGRSSVVTIQPTKDNKTDE